MTTLSIETSNNNSSIETNSISSYDRLVDIYNQIWDKPYDEKVIQLLENFFLKYLPEKAHILDLCCGTGNLIKPLLDKGYQLTGTDISEPMLNSARCKAPNSEFILSDARFLNLPPTFHGVVSLGSLNHFLSLEDLKKVFQNAFNSLLNNGIFSFNISMETLYQSEDWLNDIMADVQDKLIWVWQKKYNNQTKICTKTITILELIDRQWQRSEHTLVSTVYSAEEIKACLELVGFTEIEVYDLEKEINDPKQLGNYVFIGHKKQ